jgi:ankyrin repeat protein
MTRLMDAAVDGEGARVLRSLVNAAADVNAVNNEDKTPLRLAAEFGHPETVRLLVELKADLNKTPGAPPAVAAAYEGHADVIKVLAELGADVHGEDAKGNYPLYHAVRWDYLAVAKVLLDAKADVNAMHSGRHVLYDAGAAFWNAGWTEGLAKHMMKNKSVSLLLAAKACVDAARPSADEDNPKCQALREAFDVLASSMPVE